MAGMPLERRYTDIRGSANRTDYAGAGSIVILDSFRH